MVCCASTERRHHVWPEYDSLMCRPNLGCSKSLSYISKGFGGFYSRLRRLRTGKLSSALRLHGFAHIFGHPCGDILDTNRAQRLGHEVVGEFTAHARNQQDGLVQFSTAMGLETLFCLANQRFDHIT